MKWIISLIFIVLFYNQCSQKVESVSDFKSELPLKKENGNSKENIISKQISIIHIQPFDGLNTDLVQHIFNELKKVHPKVDLLKSIPLPKRAYYSPRKRYRADTLIYVMRSKTRDRHVTIGLTNKDISTDKGKVKDYGVMGLGYQPGKACIVSTFRLSKSNLKEQFFKVAVHELGHTQGLAHCSDEKCLMTDAKGENNTDKEDGFCDKCKAYLVSKGWNLN
jgi:archaemetzincin